MLDAYQIVIGLEVHIQLNTHSKAFAADEVNFHADANTNIGPVTLALPGTLPVANVSHIEKGIKLALAINSQINSNTYFDRKNYFYPDLPKGYQITQDKKPIAVGGQIQFKSQGNDVTIRIHHMHMEEDAGKSIHDLNDTYTLLDYNRAGTPLIELVTEPDFRSGQEVQDFLDHIQMLVKYIEICDGNMEEGSIRCDCNVSVMKKNSTVFGERCEIKNVNSKKFARQAIQYEAERQIATIENGGRIQRTTMLFDPTSGQTYPMRKKEAENDYRYFPDPDLPPIHLSESLIKKIKAEIDFLPSDLLLALTSLGINEPQAIQICQHKWLGKDLLDLSKTHLHLVKEAADLITNKIFALINDQHHGLRELINKTAFHDFLEMVNDKSISKSEAYQELFPYLLSKESKIDIKQLAIDKKMIKSNDGHQLQLLIDEVLSTFPDKVTEYKKGKKGLIGFFIGQIKMKSQQSFDATQLTKLLEDRLNQ